MLRNLFLYALLLLLGVLYAGVRLKMSEQGRKQYSHRYDETPRTQTGGKRSDEWWSADSDAGAVLAAGILQYLPFALLLTAGWASGLVLLFLLGKLFSWLTLLELKAADPQLEVVGGAWWLRHCYAALINVAGVYYYLSVPLVCLALFCVPLAVWNFFAPSTLFDPRRWRLVILLISASIMTICHLIFTLFSKTRELEPGRVLRPAEAPGVFALTREAARLVGTRPIDEIRLVPGAQLAVYERGSWQARREDRSQRILLLGVGLLEGLRGNALRGLLAHEYGHFAHRDLAGGEIALRISRTLARVRAAIERDGNNSWLNVGHLFVRLYQFLFRRLSLGATRLREMMADHAAVRAYGAEAFAAGLRHAVVRSTEFNYLVGKEINLASYVGRRVENLYGLHLTTDELTRKELKQAVNDALNARTTPENSHPCPLERVQYARRLKFPAKPLPPDGYVWDLFADRERVLADMSDLFRRELGG